MNLKRYFDKFWASLSTLSIIPCPKLDNEAYSDMGKLLMFSPAVGAVISLICTSAAAGAAFAVSKHSQQNFMPLLPAALYIVSKALLTRGFHLDGLADTFDGFGGGWTKERILEIMRDSAIGSFGAIALISVLLIQFSASVSLCTPNTHNISAVSALFLVPIFSRTIMVWQAAENRYARDSASLAGNVVSQTDRKHFFASAYIALLSSAPVLAFNFFKSGTDFIALSLISLSLGFISAAVLRAVSIKKIGGITGDILGATTEISEAVMLSFFAISV